MSKETQDITKSKAKRQAIKDAAANEKKRKVRNRVIAGVCVVAGVGVIVAGNMALSRLSVKKYLASDITAETDFSAYLTSDGKISGVKASDYVKDFDVEDVEVETDDVEYTDESLDAYIRSLTENYKTLNSDESRTAADGDTVSINYVGTIDGEEFDGGTADNQDLELGSGTFIDSFEDQLVGSKPGDDVTVNVTFPEDYGSEDLNGKDAVFAVHINGVYDVPEFDDEFVTENLSDSGYTTADEYKAAYKKQQIASLYDAAIENWISENVSLESLPDVYLHHVKGLQMTQDSYTYTQYQTLYEQYGLDFDYDNYQDFIKDNEETDTYEEARDAAAEESVTKKLIYQYVAENENIKATTDDYNDFISKNGIDEETVEGYGKAFIMQQVLDENVLRYMQDKVTIVESTDGTDTTAETETTVETTTTADTEEAEVEAADTEATESAD